MVTTTNVCQYQGCGQRTERRGYHLCRNHYHQSQSGQVELCPNCRQTYKPSQYSVCQDCHRISNQNRRNQGEWPQPEPPILPSAPDRLLRKIESVRRVITENPQSVRDSERATEMFCVIPIVSGLGWDVESPQDIVPQQRIPQGRRRADLRVDFAMQINGVPMVFVEVKRHSDYYSPEWDEQLRKYTDYMESGYGVLTNGQTWMTYTVGGNQTTHISTVDIVKEKEEAADHLHKCLSKEVLAARTPIQASERSPQSSWPTPANPPARPCPLSDQALRERLTDYRNQVSRQNGVPGYMVFSNRTIENIISVRPDNMTQLGEVSGIGARTLEQHGALILEIMGRNTEEADDLPW